MCGIIGSIGLKLKPNIFLKALSSLAHRGPDGNGYEYFKINDKDVWLGHTRLSILDLSAAGKQPMKSKDRRWCITYNGEIYNHNDLRKDNGLSCCGQSDTSTLVEMIAQNGVKKTLPYLNGMFAFAALDTQKNELYLARDPVGVKPLYYVERGESFYFASEVRALGAMGAVNGKLDSQALQAFLTLRYVPSPKSIWKNINRLPSGYFLRLNLSNLKIQVQSYIVPVKRKFIGSLTEAKASYQNYLQGAIKRQLLSDVPVGILLSGGVDSALIAAMAKNAGFILPCFTVGFGAEHPECEINQAKETAKILGLSLSSVVVTPELIRDSLPGIVRSMEEPLGTTSAMPMRHLVSQARQDVTVVLTGQGADEPWGGYQRYQIELIRNIMPGFWKMIATASQPVHKYLPDVIERGLRVLSVDRISSRALEACTLFTAQERLFLTGTSDDGGALMDIDRWCNWLGEEKLYDAVECMMRLDTRMGLADDLLLYTDKISMNVSLETRVPMLDIELLNFIESLPLSYRLSLRRSKIVHKMVAETYLPSSIVHRKKRGFQVPFQKWSYGVWRGYIEDTLFESNAEHFEYFDKKALSKLWNEHISRKRDRSRHLFSLLILAILLREMKCYFNSRSEEG